ncbi:MAG: winged helix-turn-helix domain-containing protein [Candidatus Korobacteraceae bacterium]
MSATQQLLRFGVFELNLATGELRKSGTVVRLPPQPFRLLALLAGRAGQVVSREEIQAQFWGDETEIDFERRMNQCIKQIRAALADNASQPVYVETIRLHGYRFIAPVESRTIAAAPPKVTESRSSALERAITERVMARIANASAAAAASSRKVRLRFVLTAGATIALLTVLFYWRSVR